MQLELLLLYAMGFLGPVLVYLTKYVVRGRSKDMTTLWFVTFFAYIVYYSLASGKYIVNNTGTNFGYALLWPIVAILSFWAVEKVTEKEGTRVPFFRWMVYFLIAVIFAFLIDGAAGLLGWYSYNPASIEAKTSMINPISGIQVPSLVPFMLGILMMGVFFLFTNVQDMLKAKVKGASIALLLSGIAIIMGGFLWIATDFILGIIRSM